MNLQPMSYEQILAQLRSGSITPDQRQRLQAEIQSRDRAMHNQWVAINGGQFK